MIFHFPLQLIKNDQSSIQFADPASQMIMAFGKMEIIFHRSIASYLSIDKLFPNNADEHI